MGCSNSSFEINKSKDNIQEEIRDDDIIELMKKRLEENKDKEIANHDLIKIKLLGDNLDENNNKDKINEENKDENNYELNKILLGKNKEKNNMFSEVENNKANKYYNDEDTHNDKKNKDKNKDNYMMNNDNKNNIDGQDEIMMNNDTSNFFSHNASKNNISIIDKYFKTKKLKKSIFNKTRLNDNISNRITYDGVTKRIGITKKTAITGSDGAWQSGIDISRLLSNDKNTYILLSFAKRLSKYSLYRFV